MTARRTNTQELEVDSDPDDVLSLPRGMWVSPVVEER